MATAAVTNTFVASTPAEAAEVNTNFTDLVTFLNNSVVHRDGSKAMSAAFDGGTYRLTNVGAAMAASDAPRLDQVATSDYEVTSGGITILTSATTIDTLTITAPSAGMGLLYLYGTLVTAGVSYDPGVGEGGVGVDWSVTGSTILHRLTDVDRNYGSDGTYTVTGVLLISLASGTNTVVVQATRVNSGTTSGGTVTVSSGLRSGIVGMA